MALTDLANELLLQIFCSCDALKDAHRLGATCHRLHKISQSVLYTVAEAQLGPLHDAICLATHNASQPVHLPRPAPPRSLALLKQLFTVGRVANKIVDIYPAQKWRGAFSSFRRSLTSSEAYRLRRAIYRLWLYNKAFHTPQHMGRTRRQPPIVRSRAAVLRPFPPSELAELLDALAILRGLIAYYICPSDEIVRRRHKARYPYDSYCSPQTPLNPSKRGDSSYWAASGWGDEITHYYIVEDMLKLAPDQIFWLYNHFSGAPGTSTNKDDRNAWLSMCTACEWLEKVVSAGHFAGPDEGIVRGIVDVVNADWFDNNGETVAETIKFVVEERGEEEYTVREQVAGGELGVVTGAYV